MHAVGEISIYDESIGSKLIKPLEESRRPAERIAYKSWYAVEHQ